MSIQQEIKSQLAKLLATEDLIVEHKQVETASFNVETRVLVLPLWEKASSEVYDMLVAHEVGHALFTPCDDWFERYPEIPPSFVNIVEDARIEKLMKRKYAGLPKTFFTGYKELQGMDFFKLNDIDVNKMGIADRINLYFKVGNFIDIDFTDYEKTLVSMVKSAETFDEVLEYSLVIWEYAKEELEQKKKEQEEIEEMKAKLEMEDGDGDNEQEYQTTTQGDEGDSEKSDKEDGEDDDGLDYEDEVYSKGGGITLGDEPKAETVENLEESLKDLVNQAGRETLYVEKPNDLDLDKVIIPNWFIHKNIDFEWRENTLSDFLNADNEFDEFRKSARKEVNYLVKEFEMKKAADGYARATTSRTGVLDTANLHTYKYNDDLFKKITTIPDAKSHGLIFNIDWSGSMHHNILDTIKQTLTLVSFCRKVGIDYDVYLFTDAYHKHSTSYHDLCGQIEGHVILDNFNMLNVLTSKSNNRQHDRQALNLFRIAYTIVFRSYIGIPYTMNMGGTPLNESLLAMNELIPSFKKRTGAQKIHVVCLTDGDGHPLRAGRKMQGRGYDADEVYASHMGAGYFLRDRKTGKMYAFEGGYYYSQTNQYVHYLRDRFPECSIMNIRLLASGEWHRFKQSCLGHEYNEENVKLADAQWRKTKTFICTASAWSVQYGLAASALKNDAEFEVAEDATKAQIKKAFTKSLGSKKMNKKILSSFIAQIA